MMRCTFCKKMKICLLYTPPTGFPKEWKPTCRKCNKEHRLHILFQGWILRVRIGDRYRNPIVKWWMLKPVKGQEPPTLYVK